MLIILSTVWINARGGDTTRIYYRLDNPDVEQAGKTKLDSLMYLDVINHRSEILIVGYADHLGTGGYNDTLSVKRATGVKDYLVQMGIPAGNISMCIGKGEVSRNVELPKGYAADRRVDVVLKTKLVTITGKAPKTKTAKTVVVETTQSHDAVPLNITTPIKPQDLVTGRLFVLDRIFFYTGRHRVVDESLPELEKLYRIMADNPDLEIRIEGHVCCVPSNSDAEDEDTGEIALSKNRAKYIYDYLVKKGIDNDRLSYVGFGKARPLSKNEFTQADQDRNKRVEIRVLSN